MKRYFSTQSSAAWKFFEYDAGARTLTIHWKEVPPECRHDVTPSTYQRLTEARSKLNFIRREIGTEMPSMRHRWMKPPFSNVAQAN